jgi:hypothetical protein
LWWESCDERDVLSDEEDEDEVDEELLLLLLDELDLFFLRFPLVIQTTKILIKVNHRINIIMTHPLLI